MIFLFLALGVNIGLEVSILLVERTREKKILCSRIRMLQVVFLALIYLLAIYYWITR